ncbi:MAG: TIGR02678 family protein [Rhodococcus fascians]|uniref:TIGR02678 family protein n=1 Tax=Nocardiaceae TaxID=85025 RepID=UPI00039FFFE3|nr:MULTISPECIES: TIGR02678 family protein [Rhodococcus]
MRAREIPSLALDSYQRAARVALANHLVTRDYPDRIALPLLRRWATELREDLLELFGYRLEVTETTARVYPVIDSLDPSQPARTASDRIFDRRRYAYLALAMAALGRAGNQITLSELADHVAAEAGQVDGVELEADRASDRDAFVDAVGWLAARGAISLADGDASGWASNPSSGEALYDIERSVVVALFRPPRAVQHLRSVTGLLVGSDSPVDEDSDDDAARPTDPKETLRKVRRALVERPVVYFEDLDQDGRTALAADRTVADVELLTGLVSERRAEGVTLIDTAGRMSDVRFPSTGTIAQVALLLAGEISDRVVDPDADALAHHALAHHAIVADDDLVTRLDAAIPGGGIFDDLAEFGSPTGPVPDTGTPPATYPFVENSWLAHTVADLVERFGRTFAAQWQADPDGLRERAVQMLHRLRLVHIMSGGVLVLPVIARYRDVMVSVRDRVPQDSLFDSRSTDTEIEAQ